MRKAIQRIDGAGVTREMRDFDVSWYGDGRFYCPVCGEEVVVCRGEERRYFRHRKGTQCEYAEYDRCNEGEEHESMKCYLHAMLKADNPGAYVDMEHAVSGEGGRRVIADVYAETEFNGVTYRHAFEIQKSKMTEERILDKNDFYRSCGVNVTWITHASTGFSPYPISRGAFVGGTRVTGHFEFDEKVLESNGIVSEYIDRMNAGDDSDEWFQASLRGIGTMRFVLSKRSIREFRILPGRRIVKSFKLYGNSGISYV